MTPGDPTDVDQILQTILVPSFPPNRSQWRKLDLALKFINKSKTSANHTKTEYGKKKEISVVPQQVDDREIIQNKKDINANNEIFNCRQLANPKSVNLKKQSSWSKIKHSVQHIM